MRNILLLLLLCVAAVSGCLDNEDAPDDTMDDEPMEDMVAAPEPLTYTGSLNAVATGQGVEPACMFQDLSCETIDVPIPEGTWKVTFTLHSHDGTVDGQGVPFGADYELVALGQTSTNPGEEAEVISGVVEGPSTETVEIQAWHAIDGTYELIVSFAQP